MADKPAFAFVGDMSGPLAQAVAPQVTLVPFTAATAMGRTGVLIDGAAADPGAQVLQQVMESGEILSVANPHPEQRESLLALTGAGPAAAVPLVTYLPAPDGRGFSCNVVPAPGTLSSCWADDAGAHPIDPEPIPPLDLGEQLSQVAAALAALPADPGTSWVPGFGPPHPGTTAGRTSFTTQMNWNVAAPQKSNGKYDDKTVLSHVQSITGNLLRTEFYVYWVNGVTGSTAPYFVVIVRQTGPMVIGEVRAKSEHSKGYFQLYFNIGPNGFPDAEKNQPTDGFSLDTYQPTSAGSNQFVSSTMPLWGDSGAGTGTYSFTAAAQITETSTGWAVDDHTSGRQSRWQFHQHDAWDPTQTGWDQVPEHPSHFPPCIWDNHGHVTQFPDTSFGSIHFETITAWNFVPPVQQGSQAPFPPPPSYRVRFSGSFGQAVALAHDPDGCAGAFGGKHRHVFGHAYTTPCSWTLDLSHIAQLMNYPQQQVSAL